MRLRCVDGNAREFSIARVDGEYSSKGRRNEGYTEAKCTLCGHGFGFHDTKILKPLFKQHCCAGGR
jgi:hypothetical protein